jgi:histone H4
MPRRFDGNAAPLLSLGDGIERQLRLARMRESQQEAAPTDDEGGSPPDVDALNGNGNGADPFGFEEEPAVVLQGVAVEGFHGQAVDGMMAHEEDAAEMAAAEEVVAGNDAANDHAAAAALQAADTEPEEEEEAAPFVRPVVRFVPAGRGKGKGAKRHQRKVLRDNIQGITKPAIRRLARRGGVRRISGLSKAMLLSHPRLSIQAPY